MTSSLIILNILLLGDLNIVERLVGPEMPRVYHSQHAGFSRGAPRQPVPELEEDDDEREYQYVEEEHNVTQAGSTGMTDEVRYYIASTHASGFYLVPVFLSPSGRWPY